MQLDNILEKVKQLREVTGVGFKDCKNAIEEANGDGVKKLLKEEVVVRDWAYHSVVTIKSIKKGDIFTRENLGVKRPGTGIPAENLNLILGKTALVAISVNEQVTISDVQDFSVLL